MVERDRGNPSTALEAEAPPGRCGLLNRTTEGSSKDAAAGGVREEINVLSGSEVLDSHCSCRGQGRLRNKNRKV